MKDFIKKNWLRVLLTIACLVADYFVGVIGLLWLAWGLGVDGFLAFGSFIVLPALVLPLIWCKKEKRKKCIIGWVVFILIFVIILAIPFAIDKYEKSITVKEVVNINTDEYLPFDKNSKIAVLDEESTLKLTENLPRIDGAAAFFPVYSAYVNAVYPDTVELYEGFIPANRIGQYTFVYSNTVLGYEELAEKKTDIFFGVYPSEEQIEYAKDNGTEFEFTQIGTEAFVFFVHKDNPVDDVTVEELKDIYSGKTRNWISLGGKLKGIKAYQRNEGSGSQSMLERFMGDTPIMKPPTHLVQGFMSGIIEEVSEYQNRNSAIGFSFRYYVDGIIGNPDIKVLKVNGVAPTDENIKNGTYPIVTPIYAVTWAGNEKPTVKPFLNWVLSEEGQEILEKSGYVGLAELPKEAHPEPVDKDKAFSDISRNEGGYFERALHVDEP